MKTKLLIAILLTSVCASAQISPPPGYLGRNTKEVVLASGATLTHHVPAGAAPTLNGGWSRSGALYYDSVGGGRGLHYYSSPSWFRLVDSSELADSAAALRTAIGTGGGGGGTTNHTLLSNLAWAGSGHTGNATSIAAFDGSGAATYKVIGTDIQAYNARLAQIVGLSMSNDDIFQMKAGVITNRTIAQLKTDLNYTIPAQFNPIAGTGISLTGTYPNITFNAFEDTNWVHLIAYGTPNDGLQDTTALQTAVATGKSVIIDPGIWYYPGKGNGIVLAKGQVIRGYGLVSQIYFTADTINVFNMSNDSAFIDQISFVGKGRGAYPGAEVFSYSNAIKIGGSYNKVRNCYFSKVKGAGVTLWASATIYGNDVSFNSFDSCGIGIYALTNAEYGQFLGNKMQYCRSGFTESCAGNNNWLNITSLYCDYGARIFGSSGCNGDHGQITASIFNHNTTALDFRQVYNEYSVVNCKFYFGNIEFGSTDTVKRVIMDNCVFSGNTINVTKALQSQVTGGTFGTSAVTVNAGSGVKFCNIQNSPYSTVACVSGSGSLQDVTDVGASTNHDITLTATNLKFDNGSTNVTTLHALTSSGASTLNLPNGNNGDTLATKAYARSVGGGGGSSYTFSTGLTESGGTVTNNLSTGVSGGQTLIAGTGTGDGLVLKSTTANATGTGSSYDFTAGNNGAKRVFQILNNGSASINANASSGFGLLIKSPGTAGLYVQDQFGSSIFYVPDGGDVVVGKAASNVHTFAGRSDFGTINTALTNTVSNTIKATHITSGTAANGFGVGMLFDAENGSGTQKSIGNINATYTDVTNASEDADFIIRLIRAGTLTEAGRFTSVGGFSINGSVGTSGDVLTSGGAGAAASWTTLPTLASGTWTPTITGLSNVSSSSGPTGKYTRTGSIVNFTIYVTITATSAATNTSFTASLPISSALSGGTDVIGTTNAINNTTYVAGKVATGSGTINVQFISITNTGDVVQVSGQYIIN